MRSPPVVLCGLLYGGFGEFEFQKSNQSEDVSTFPIIIINDVLPIYHTLGSLWGGGALEDPTSGPSD
jgi:hypothetical protein